TGALLSDGKILIGGGFRLFSVDDGEGDDDDGDGATDDDTLQPYIARRNADGTMDKSVKIRPNPDVRTIQVYADGRVAIGGDFSTVTIDETSYSRASLARFNTDGTIDEDFDPAPNGDVYDLELQPDGKLLVGGAFTLFTK